MAIITWTYGALAQQPLYRGRILSWSATTTAPAPVPVVSTTQKVAFFGPWNSLPHSLRQGDDRGGGGGGGGGGRRQAVLADDEEILLLL